MSDFYNIVDIHDYKGRVQNKQPKTANYPLLVNMHFTSLLHGGKMKINYHYKKNEKNLFENVKPLG